MSNNESKILQDMIKEYLEKKMKEEEQQKTKQVSWKDARSEIIKTFNMCETEAEFRCALALISVLVKRR